MAVRFSFLTLLVGTALQLGAASPSSPSTNAASEDNSDFYQSWCPIEVDVSLAFDDFRSLPEGSWEGNMGAFVSGNLKAYLPLSFTTQLGGSYGLYDWAGRSSTPFRNSGDLQQQGFITVGASRETPGSSGVNAGFVYDAMLNRNFGLFAVNPYLDQIRAQLGYLIKNGHELGLWASYGITTSHEEAEQIPLKFRAVSQANLFYCYYFKGHGYGMIWAGVPYRKGLMYKSGMPGAYTLGARLSAPLSKCLTLSAHAGYMGGRHTSTSSNAQNYAANVCFSLTYSFGYRKIKQTPYMNLGDNSNFFADTNYNF